MKDLDQRILDFKAKINDKGRLKEKLDKIYIQRGKLEKKKKELLENLKREELDVEKLEGMSFANLFHSIKGDKVEKLQKEKEEAFAAKLKYDSICNELRMLDNEIEGKERKLLKLKDIEKEYEDLLNEKQDILISTDGSIRSIFSRLQDEEAEEISKEKEIEEAISAGEVLLQSLYRVRDHLQSASSWGTWDILGGGFIATMAKHSKIDDAKNEISAAQGYLRSFYRELQDVGTTISIDIEIGSFLTFADYFFDGLFADLTVQSKINDSKIRVKNTIDDVGHMLDKLRNQMVACQMKRNNIYKRKLEIIENSPLE